MAAVTVRNIRIEYETFGDPAAAPLLLIAGLGCQLIHWDASFCRALSEGGFYVIRFDNRDATLSSKFEHNGVIDLLETTRVMLGGGSILPPYTLEEMALDAVGLMDALRIEQAHICGMSMGGMIAQTMAIRHPARALSLISIYSSTGNPALPPPQPQALEWLMKPPPATRSAYIEYTVALYRALAGSGLPFDEGFHRRMAARSFERSFYPQGTVRQYTAVMTQPDRREALSVLSLPTLVIHGDEDPLVQIACGRDTADAIPDAEFLVIPGMGHELPTINPYWSRIADAIIRHGRRDR